MGRGCTGGIQHTVEQWPQQADQQRPLLPSDRLSLTQTAKEKGHSPGSCTPSHPECALARRYPLRAWAESLHLRPRTQWETSQQPPQQRGKELPAAPVSLPSQGTQRVRSDRLRLAVVPALAPWPMGTPAR